MPDKMKITDLTIQSFRTHADRFQHGVYKPKQELVQTITTIDTDQGTSGYYLGGGSHGDQEGLSADDQRMLLGRLKSLLVGQDPLDREMIWKWFWVANIPENVASVVDLALWDLAGRAANLPVYKLMGGARDRVKAYASTYPNLGAPQVYAEHALQCKRQGYLAYKIHPHYFWDPATRQPTPGRPSNVAADIETCRLVREAVGPDYLLMYDPWGTYHSLEEALRLAACSKSWTSTGTSTRCRSIASKITCRWRANCAFPFCRRRSPPAACLHERSGSCAARAT